MTITIRAIADHEIEAFRSTIFTVFGFDPSLDPQGAERMRALIDLSRTYCAFEGSQLVATSGTFSFDLSVPGAIVPMGGLTMVTVRPTHRRRGILSAMIAAHLADVQKSGEPLSGLWASEGGIYGRFGYGVAAEGDELRFSGVGPQIVCDLPTDELRALDDAEAAQELPAIYERARRARPGMFLRNEAWWRHRRFSDRADLRKGRSPRIHLLCRRAGVPTGYLVYRLGLGYDEGTAAGQVDIEELVAEDPRAESTLLRFVANVDLFPKVSWWNAPPDCLLPWILRDPRAAVRKRRIDTLWLRVDDVPRALAARRYVHDGVLRLSVDDRCYELAVEQGVARCAEVDHEPQLRLSLRTLGSLYLGSTPASRVARAGLVQGSERALAEADRLLMWPIASWCPEIF